LSNQIPKPHFNDGDVPPIAECAGSPEQALPKEERMDAMDVGFIGVGSMGSRIVDLMLDAGHQLTLWARRREALTRFGDRVKHAASPAEVARASDMVGICVWNEQDIDEVLGGDHGVLAGVRPGAVIAIHSTVSPHACRRLRQTALLAGAELIDATVSVGSQLPKLLMMVGGDRDAVNHCRGALESVADPFLHLGPVGAGQIAKLVNNTLLAATVGLADDAIALGSHLGLDPTALGVALAAGSARGTWSSFIDRHPATGGAPPIPQHTAWARKDVGFTLDLSEEANLDLDRSVLRLARRGIEVIG
jgi:3-hydroxyisobutyrate dehydrogenase